MAADDQGGFVYQRDDWSDLPMIGRVDETGNQTWLISAPNLPAPGVSSNLAIHPDGTVYFAERDYLNTGNSPTAVMALDELSGQMKFAVPLLNGTYTGFDYSYLEGPNGPQYCTPGTSTASVVPASTFGHLTISSDGIVYLPVLTGTSSFDAMPCDASPDPNHPGYPHVVKSTDGIHSASNSLQVMAIHSDGTYSTRQLDSTSPGLSQYSILGGATPDGNGGTLLAVNNSGTSSSSPSTFYHDTGSSVSKFNLSFNPTGEILTGEDGTAYLAGANPSPSTTGALAAINTSSNAINWTDSLPSMGYLQQLLAVPAAGGVVFEDSSGHLNVTDPNGVITPLFPGSGGTDAGPVGSANANYWTLGTWYASLSDGSLLAPITGPVVIMSSYGYAYVGGDPEAQHKAKVPIIHTFVPDPYACLPNINPCNADTADPLSPKKLTDFLRSRYAGQAELQGFPSSLATYPAFQKDIQKPLQAFGFIGHSFEMGAPPTSVGLLFYIQDPANPQYKHDAMIQHDYFGTFDQASNPAIKPEDVVKLQTQPTVIFIAACETQVAFKKLWDIDQNTIGRALIIPQTNVLNPAQVDLSWGATAWTAILDSLLQGKSVTDAKNDGNAAAAPKGSQYTWQVIGDGSVTIAKAPK